MFGHKLGDFIDYHYYLTTTGSCIDFGEEGAVGRGNKTHGIIRCL